MDISIVPPGTRFIARNQFQQLELDEITLPEGLEAIRAHAFSMSKLRRLAFPSTLKTIGFRAFFGCEMLEEVILPPGLEKIDSWAFSGCEHLKSVVCPNTAVIGTGAFYEYRQGKQLCGYCGAPLDTATGKCSAHCPNENSWQGAVALGKGIFWWTGTELLYKKAHCQSDGSLCFSESFFQRSPILSHREEWNAMGIPSLPFNYYPRGRVEISRQQAKIYLHPAINCPEAIEQITAVFGLTSEHGIKEIRMINDHSYHYATLDERNPYGKRN